MRRAVSRLMPYAAVIALAWAGTIIGLAWSPPGFRLKEAGVPLGVIRGIYLSWNLLVDLIPFLIGCWLLWRLAAAIRTPYRWGAPVLGGFALLVQLSLFLAVTLTSRAPSFLSTAYDIEGFAWFSFLPAALTLLALVVAAEPYASMHLPRPLATRAWLFALGTAALIVASSAAQSSAGWMRIVTFPLYLLHLLTWGLVWGTSGVLTVIGLPGGWPLVIADVFWVLVVWHLVIRILIAWRFTQRAAVSMDDSDDGLPDGDQMEGVAPA